MQAVDTNYEKENKVNCFSNLVMNFGVEWWISILNIVHNESIQFNVKFHSFHLYANSNCKEVHYAV